MKQLAILRNLSMLEFPIDFKLWIMIPVTDKNDLEIIATVLSLPESLYAHSIPVVFNLKYWMSA